MAKSHAMARCQGYIASVRKGKKKKTTKKSFSLITKKPVTPSSQELKLNPPSRSAKLRAIKKIGLYENNMNVFEKYASLLKIENFSKKLLKNI